MPTRLLAPLALLVVALLPAPAGAATRIDVETVAQRVLNRITAASDVPVYLPTSITIRGNGRRAFASGGAQATPDGWSIELGYTRGCGGANACSMASFYAERGGQAFGSRRVPLARGVVGRFQPLSCGASCSPASISFVLDGVAYSYSVKDPAGRVRPALITLANQAIRYGPR